MDNFIQLQQSRNPIHWQIAEPFVESFRNFQIHNITNFRVIKESPARTVLEIFWYSQPYILKIFHSPLITDRLHQWISPRHWQEWRNVTRLQQIGLPVPTPVAVGDGDQHSVLILQKIVDTVSLKEIFQTRNVTFSERRQWISQLAKLTANLHNHQLIHRDFHSGNLLLDKQGKLHLIDVYNIANVHFFSTRQFLMNLAMLGDSFTLYAHMTDYLVFLREYHTQSQHFNRWTWEELVESAIKIFWEYRYRYWTIRAKRCLKNNKYFQTYHFSNWFGIGYRQQHQLNQKFQDIQALIQIGEKIKDSHSTLVVRTPVGILKKFRRKKLRNWIIDWFRPSRACTAWLKGYHCLVRDIKTAKPIFYADKKFLWFPYTSYLITEEILPGKNLLDRLTELADIPQAKERLLYQVGRFIRLLHQRGLTHRDLKGSNWLVDEHEQLFLIDLDGLSVTNTIPSPRRRQKDLDRLLRSLLTLPTISSSDISQVKQSYFLLAMS